MWWLGPLQGLESRITLNILSHWHFFESARCTCFEILVCIREASFECNRWFIYMHRCVTSRHQSQCRAVGRSFPSIYGVGLVGKALTSTRATFVSTPSSPCLASPRMSKLRRLFGFTPCCIIPPFSIPTLGKLILSIWRGAQPFTSDSSNTTLLPIHNR